MATRYTVGIDLGTSNTVVAFAAAGEDRIQVLEIEQLVGRGELAARALLPSVRYHPAAGELDPATLRLAASLAGLDEVDKAAVMGAAVVGQYARELGAQVPGRAVASAKSWLSHAGVDRSAAILPWGAAEDVPKVSPVVASASYLAHVRAAWRRRHPEAPLEDQDIVLTVPASFDEGARALTLEAARLAGLPHLRLLEEPQAAFHDWLFRHRERLATELAQSRLLLVCDVGGGTTDLTLIQVEPAADGVSPPRLTRIGVGDHLMLGGDNMDLALAHLVEQRLLASGERLSAAQLSQLVQRCRAAKEQLLAADAPEQVKVTLLGAGARLIGAARSTELRRDEVLGLVVDGFLPVVATHEAPRRRRAAIVEFGLPYPADPAISRHLAAFLQRHGQVARAALGMPAAEAGGNTAGDADAIAVPPAIPDTLLLNGGVFRANALSARLETLLKQWRGAPLRVLHNDAPDVAVARGAVAFALVRAARAGLGPGIGGGSARSYFLVLEDAGEAARAICVLPRGTESGVELALPERRFALRLGQPVRFHLVSSTSDTAWQAGELVDLARDDFIRLPPLTARLPPTSAGRKENVVVRLVATLTEVGTLEMQCVSVDDDARRWQLAFPVRAEADADAADTSAASATPGVHPRLDQAIALIEQTFGGQAQQVAPKEVRQLRSRLERVLGRREDWDMALLRTLFDALLERARRRRRSAEHERVWLNLAGYCLRPGLGAALDDWRIDQLWALFAQGIQYVQESNNWSEWWTLWRRSAGGLAEDRQLQILEVLAGHLEHADAARRRGDPVQGSYDDMVRLSAALERVPAMHRIEVGRWLLERLQRPGENPHTWWALGRVGARESLYGSAHNVVPPETAAEWLQAVLALDWKAVEPAAFAAAQIARLTGDRTRDLAPALRDEVARRLTAIRAPQSWITMVREIVSLDDADRRRSFGESLPPGLKLI